MRDHTKQAVFSFALMGLLFLLSGCIMLCPSKPHSTATGWISGKVVDETNRPVADAEIKAIYVRGWTIFYPPCPNGFLVGTDHTDSNGCFRLFTAKRVDELSGASPSFKSRGELHGVKSTSNIIYIRSLQPRFSP